MALEHTVVVATSVGRDSKARDLAVLRRFLQCLYAVEGKVLVGVQVLMLLALDFLGWAGLRRVYCSGGHSWLGTKAPNDFLSHHFRERCCFE